MSARSERMQGKYRVTSPVFRHFIQYPSGLKKFVLKDFSTTRLARVFVIRIENINDMLERGLENQPVYLKWFNDGQVP